MYVCSRCHFRHLQGRFCFFWVRIEARWSGNAYFERVRGVFRFEKYRFCETMLIELSTVGFAPLGSYWSPLIRKRLFWTSSGCSYAHRSVSWSPVESSRIFRSRQESWGVLSSSQESCGVLRSLLESWGVFRSLQESCGVRRSPVESCAICRVRRFIKKPYKSIFH